MSSRSLPTLPSRPNRPLPFASYASYRQMRRGKFEQCSPHTCLRRDMRKRARLRKQGSCVQGEPNTAQECSKTDQLGLVPLRTLLAL